MKTVVVFGAGVAGLTVAHEFVRLGYKVFVYEANKNAGGFFRSSRTNNNNTPTEYSWHGMGPWYYNVFDIMKQIPADEHNSVYDKNLSRPINFGIALDHADRTFTLSSVFENKKEFRMSLLEKCRWAWLMIKTWIAHRRSQEYYSTVNAAHAWNAVLSDTCAKIWKSTFGPWIGSDWKNASLHHVGHFFRKNILSGPAHYHKADDQGPAWAHGSGDGWLLLRGPSNECWLDQWVAYLMLQGVEFFWEESLHTLDFDGYQITAAYLASGNEVKKADIYVLAINPFAVADIVKRTPALKTDAQLRLFEPLTNDGPHTQVSLRIAFSERIKWPVERSAIIIANSEFDLTLFAQEQVWPPTVELGTGIQSLWTVTACVATVPGRLYGLPLTACTKEQFITEVMAQIMRCEQLDCLIKEANHGRSLKSFSVDHIEVWHEWLFSPTGITAKQPKWVNSTHNQKYLPTQATSIVNLLLAGAHTQTTADLWSIEAAVESGRRAVRIVEPQVTVMVQYKPLWLRALGTIDDLCFAMGLPHILDLLLIGICVVVVGLVVKML